MPSFSEHAHASLTRLAADGADALQIADSVVAVWRELDAALSPIIGGRGVAALFKRSLLLTAPEHTSLVADHWDVQAQGDFDALRASLKQQSVANAIATHGALLQQFIDLLTTLIGKSLTERLLQSVLDNPPRHGAVQELSS
jgi:hypothetical protein